MEGWLIWGFFDSIPGPTGQCNGRFGTRVFASILVSLQGVFKVQHRLPSLSCYVLRVVVSGTSVCAVQFCRNRNIGPRISSSSCFVVIVVSWLILVNRQLMLAWMAVLWLLVGEGAKIEIFSSGELWSPPVSRPLCLPWSILVVSLPVILPNKNVLMYVTAFVCGFLEIFLRILRSASLVGSYFALFH